MACLQKALRTRPKLRARHPDVLHGTSESTARPCLKLALPDNGSPPMSRLPELTRLVRILTRKHQTAMSLQRICDELECSESSAKRYIRELRDTFQYPIEFDRELGGREKGFTRHVGRVPTADAGSDASAGVNAFAWTK